MKCPHLLMLAAVVLPSALACHAQISLQSAVSLALKNSPGVRGAVADRDKAIASMQEIRDAYIPVVATQGGYGQSTGAPTGVPVVFNISAQSLGFSFQQKDNMRAARMSVESAESALEHQEATVEQDIANTYVSLANAQARQVVLRAELAISDRFSQVVQERVDAGFDPRVELPRAHRTGTQLRLAALQLEAEISGFQTHLAIATGLPSENLHTVPSSIPGFSVVQTTPASSGTQSDLDDPSIRALEAAARAKQFIAFADKRYMLRPQVYISAYYSRVYTGSSSYLDYYPCFDGTSGRRGTICYDGTTTPQRNSENALGVGFQITLPILDFAHRAKARASQAEAVRAAADVDAQRALVLENNSKLRHSVDSLQLKLELAQEEQEIAAAQLGDIRLQLQSSSSAQAGQQLTPKDELNAQLQERQRYYDLLASQLQLQQAQLNLLQQSGDLSQWIASNSRSIPLASPLPGGAPASVHP